MKWRSTLIVTMLLMAITPRTTSAMNLQASTKDDAHDQILINALPPSYYQMDPQEQQMYLDVMKETHRKIMEAAAEAKIADMHESKPREFAKAITRLTQEPMKNAQDAVDEAEKMYSALQQFEEIQGPAWRGKHTPIALDKLDVALQNVRDLLAANQARSGPGQYQLLVDGSVHQVAATGRAYRGRDGRQPTSGETPEEWLERHERERENMYKQTHEHQRMCRQQELERQQQELVRQRHQQPMYQQQQQQQMRR